MPNEGIAVMLAPRWAARRRHVAIDLGTAFLRVAAKDVGVLTIATARMARPPLRRGVVADPGGVADLLRPVLRRTRRLGILGPRVTVGIPTDADGRERTALLSALCAAGAVEVAIIPEPHAAAIGTGVAGSPYAHLLVDMGEGVTDCAIIRDGSVLASRTIRIGCGDLRAAVQTGHRRHWGVSLSPVAAEELIAEAGVGSGACPPGNEGVAWRDGDRAGEPGVTLSAVRAFLEPCVSAILATINAQAHGIPDDLGCEVIESGIVLTGGGALLPGMRARVRAATSIEVVVPPNPLDVVLDGMVAMADEY